MVTSQNGWAPLSSDSPKLHTWQIGDTALRLRNGSAGFLLAHLALWFDERVEDLDGRILDDWGYAFRPIRGYVALSNHASGTAMDLNATQHVLGAEDTFTDEEERRISRRLRLYGGCIRWGGDYRGRKDEMHFEINRDLKACERRARALLTTPRGKTILSANPGQRRVILS